MYKYFIPVFVMFAFVFVPVVGYTQDSNGENLESLKAALVEQIEELKARVSELQEKVEKMRSEQQTLREETDALRRELREGMRGEDVEKLQEVLATDSSVYPEGLVTGYFGPLTKAAVRRFRMEHDLGEKDEVSGKSLEVLNRLITEGAGNSGNIPPGLLTAPGLANVRCAAGLGEGSLCVIDDNEEDENDEEDEDDDGEENEGNEDEDENEDEETSVEIEFEDGEYSIEGSVFVATSCRELDVTVDVLDEDPERVVVEIETVEGEGDDCAQVITERTFEEAVEAEEDAEIEVFLDGESIPFDLGGEEEA